VHRDKFLIIKPTRRTDFSNLFLEWNSTCFGQFLCPSSGVFHCTHSNGICHTGYDDSLWAGAFALAQLGNSCEIASFCSSYLLIKPTRCTNISNLFWNETINVSDSSSVHHREFFTVHTAMVYVIQVMLTAREQEHSHKK